MKSEKEIQEQLEKMERQNRTEVKYENHEGIIITQSWMRALEWVLQKHGDKS